MDENCLAVANKPGREHNEKIISDDNGGAIIVREQQDNFGQWNYLGTKNQ